jgi:hypothetical protein
LPCTPFVNYEHLFVDYDKTYGDYIDFSTNCDHNSDDCANTHNNWVNTIVDLVDMPNISSLDLSIPNLTLMQLLLICKS